MPAVRSSLTGLKRFIPARATDLCNQLVDTSAIALCAADEVLWRYLESSHNPYAKLLHKGLTAGPKKLGPSAIDTTTAEAFDELQAGLSVLEDEELKSRIGAAGHQTTEEEEIELGRLGHLLTSASVTVAIGIDEAVRTLSATRLGGMLGLPQLKFDSEACSGWSELHHELSSVPVYEDEEAAACSSLPTTSPSTHNGIVALPRPHSTLALASFIAKRAVAAVPLSDFLLFTIVSAADRLAFVGGSQVPQLSTEAAAWDELHAHFSL